MLSGIDFSDKNGAVNWQNIAQSDVQFAYFKATEALNLMDQSFEANCKEAKRSEILFGVYHVFHPEFHAGQQAEFFLETVGELKDMLPPVVCLTASSQKINDSEKVTKSFLDILAKKIGVKPFIYTNEKYWNENMADAGWACEYPLWLDRPGANWPAQMFPWAGWTFWQYSYQSQMPGIPNYLGFNWFNGTQEELQSMVIQ